MYIRVFSWVETRANSELGVRLVPLNMLKLSSFLPAQISSIVFLNVKNLAFTANCGVCVGGGGGCQAVITIQTSTMTRCRLQYHVCRPVLAGGAVVTNAFHSHNACWYMRALNNNGNEQGVTKIEKKIL